MYKVVEGFSRVIIIIFFFFIVLVVILVHAVRRVGSCEVGRVNGRACEAVGRLVDVDVVLPLGQGWDAEGVRVDVMQEWEMWGRAMEGGVVVVLVADGGGWG